MKILKHILNVIYKILAALFSLLVLYLSAAIILGLIPVNHDFKEADEGVEIFISSNGLHADLILPIDTLGINWKNFIDPLYFEGSPAHFKQIGFGWGDKGFYTQTPTWGDLQFRVAVKAVLIPSEAAFNVSYYSKKVETNDFTKKVTINTAQYLQLVSFIKESFIVDEKGQPFLIEGVPYVTNNNFYKAKGRYHLFNTSNNWTNKALKAIGVRTAVWAPFDRSILYHFD